MNNRTFLQRFVGAPEFGPLVLLIVELAVFTFINPAFMSVLNISNILTFTVELGLITLAAAGLVRWKGGALQNAELIAYVLIKLSFMCFFSFFGFKIYQYWRASR